MDIFRNKIFKNILCALFLVVFFLTYFASAQISHANSSDDCDDPTRCGVGRIRACHASGTPEGLNFDPTQNGADISFDLSNQVCLAIVGSSYAAVKIALNIMCNDCGLTSRPSLTPSPVRDSALLATGNIKSVTGGGQSCQIATSAANASFFTFLANLTATYLIANNAFENTTVCGASWLSPDPDKYNISKGGTKAEREQWVKSNPTVKLSDNIQSYNEWYYGGIEYEDNPSKSDYCEDPTTGAKSSGHFPRQKYYLRGTAAGNFNCSKYDRSLINTQINPNATTQDYDKAFACCKSRVQNFICIDYQTKDSSIANSNKLDPLQDNRGVFCKSGESCTIKGITFSAAPIETNDSRLICAQTYSLCPYNFTIGKGGTKYCDYFQDGIKKNGKYTYITPDDITKATDPAADPTTRVDCSKKSEIRNADCTYNEKAGQCKNYCQYLTHCTVAGTSNYQYKSGLESPYFSSACYNFVGDSRNQNSFDSGIVLGNQRHFSAPIAQCVKETLENVFYNKAGHSKCLNLDETPNADGTCPSGNYIHSGSFTYKKGSQVKDTSFFSKIQNNLQDAVKMVLSLAIMFYGLKILIGHNMSEMKKSDIMMFIIRLGLVMYFSTGDAWQTMFFDGVYNSSMTFSKMVFHIESSMPDIKKDGCQFDSASLGVNNQYPAGKDYLSMWDTLDCKIARYLGFGPTMSTANIAKLVFAGLFVGPYGIYFVLGLMFFGFFFVAAAIRALHIFLSSAMSIIIMVYISPIIIPTALFPSKTGSIFKSWLTNLISFCLQPMILFAYIAIFITVFDSTMIGSATFKGEAPNKSISCDSVCKDNSGTVVTGDKNCTQASNRWAGGKCKDANNNAIDMPNNDPYVDCINKGFTSYGATCRDPSGNDVGADPDCSKPDHTLVDPINDSIACLINVDSYHKINFLESVGISVPSISNLFTSHVKEKILTIIKAAFVMFVLCQLMDQIPSITDQLIGGASLPGAKTSATGIMNSVGGIAEGIRERITRGGMKLGTDTYREIKELAEKEGGGGKSAASAPSGSDDTESTNGGGGDETSGSVGGEGESQGGGEASEGESGTR